MCIRRSLYETEVVEDELVRCIYTHLSQRLPSSIHYISQGKGKV